MMWRDGLSPEKSIEPQMKADKRGSNIFVFICVHLPSSAANSSLLFPPEGTVVSL